MVLDHIPKPGGPWTLLVGMAALAELPAESGDVPRVVSCGGAGRPATDQSRKVGVVGVDSWADVRGGSVRGLVTAPSRHQAPLAGSAGCPVVGVMARGTWRQPNTAHWPWDGEPASVSFWGCAGHGGATWLPNGAWWAGSRPQVS